MSGDTVADRTRLKGQPGMNIVWFGLGQLSYGGRSARWAGRENPEGRYTRQTVPQAHASRALCAQVRILAGASGQPYLEHRACRFHTSRDHPRRAADRLSAQVTRSH